MSSTTAKAAAAAAGGSSSSSRQQQQQPSRPTRPPTQLLALLLVQDTPPTRSSFRHTLQWLLHPVLKYISASAQAQAQASAGAGAGPSSFSLMVGAIVYSPGQLHTVAFQPALDFLKTCAANARFPFTASTPSSVQQAEQDDLFASLVALPTPPASPTATTESSARGAASPRRRAPEPVNAADVLSAVIQMFQERSSSMAGLDPTNPLPPSYPATHSRHLIHVSHAGTVLDFSRTPTSNALSAHDSMTALELAHEFSKLRALSSAAALDDATSAPSHPEMAITSFVARTPSTSSSQASGAKDVPDSQRLHWLLALSIASQDPIPSLADVDTLGPSVPDIYDNAKDIIKTEEYDSLMAHFQGSSTGQPNASQQLPLLLFSNFLATVRPSSRHPSLARAATALVQRKRSLDALRSSAASTAAGGTQQVSDGVPAAKRLKLESDAQGLKLKDDGTSKAAGLTRTDSTGVGTQGATTNADAKQAAQLPTSTTGVNLPPNLSAAERNKFLFLNQQHALMLKNLAAIQNRIQQDQQQSSNLAQDEDKRKVSAAQAHAQVQNVEAVRAKILGEQKALQASLIAMSTPPANKSAALDQQAGGPSWNLNDNLRRTMDIDTHARTLGLDLGGLNDQLQAQIHQTAMAKQQQQQLLLQQHRQQQAAATSAAAPSGGQAPSQLQASSSATSTGTGPTTAPGTSKAQPNRPHTFWSGQLMLGFSGSGAPGQAPTQLATMVSAVCPTTSNEADLLLPWPKQLKVQQMLQISSIRELQAVAASRVSPIQCVLFSTVPPNPGLPSVGLASAQAQAEMEAQNDKIYSQLSKLLEVRRGAALIKLPATANVPDDPNLVGPGLLLIGVPPPASAGPSATHKLLGLVLKEGIPRSLIVPSATSSGTTSAASTAPVSAPHQPAPGPPIQATKPASTTGTGTPASAYIGNTFGAAQQPQPAPLAPAPLGVSASPALAASAAGGTLNPMNIPYSAIAAAALAVRQQQQQQQQNQQPQQQAPAMQPGQLPNYLLGNPQALPPSQAPIGAAQTTMQQGQAPLGQFAMPFAFNGMGVGAASGGMMPPFGIGPGAAPAMAGQPAAPQMFMPQGHNLGLSRGAGAGGATGPGVINPNAAALGGASVADFTQLARMMGLGG